MPRKVDITRQEDTQVVTSGNRITEVVRVYYDIEGLGNFHEDIPKTSYDADTVAATIIDAAKKRVALKESFKDMEI